MQRSK